MVCNFMLVNKKSNTFKSQVLLILRPHIDVESHGIHTSISLLRKLKLSRYLIRLPSLLFWHPSILHGCLWLVHCESSSVSLMMVVISGNITYFLTCFLMSCISHVILCCLLAPTSGNVTDGGAVTGREQFFIISLLVSHCHIHVGNPTKH